MKELQDWVTQTGEWHIQQNSGEYQTPTFKMETLCGIIREGYSYATNIEDLKPCEKCFMSYLDKHGKMWTKSCFECGYLMPVSGSVSHVEGTCFSCGHWLEIFQKIEADPNEWITALAKNIYADNNTGKVADTWTLYQFEEGIFSGRWLGSGGAKITFTFADGREVTSNNVGCAGDVPSHFLQRFMQFKAEIKRG